MDRGLLSAFDTSIAARGYENRSEALRDLIRADLTKAAWDAGAVVIATLTVVYLSQLKEPVIQLADAPAEATASLHVRIDAQHSMQVYALRGSPLDLSAFAGRLSGTRGVLSCELTLATPVTAP